MKNINMRFSEGASEEHANFLADALRSAFPQASVTVKSGDIMPIKFKDKTVASRSTAYQAPVKEFDPHARPDGGYYGRD